MQFLKARDRFCRKFYWISLLALLAAGFVSLSLSFVPCESIDAVIGKLEPAALSKPIDASGSQLVGAVLKQRESDAPSMEYASLDGRKLSGMLRVFGIVFLLNAAAVIVASRRTSPHPSLHIFPFAVALSLLILLVGYRTVIGAGMGLDRNGQDSSTTASGIILNDVDNLSYASWATQAKEGRFTFEVLHTTEDHDAVYINPYFVLVGRAARALDIPVLAVLNFAGLGAACVTVICVYYITVFAGLPILAARWATFLTAFSSGLSSVMTCLHALLGIPLLLGVDVIYLEAIMFTTFCCWPYQACMLALLAMAILCITVCETRRGGWSKVCFVALPFIILFLASSHPYDALMLLGSYFVFALLSHLWASDRVDWNRRILLLILLAAPVLPATAYSYWVSQQPVWSHFAQAALGEWRPRWAWLIGYGLTVPLGIAGAIRCLRRRESPAARWIAVWTLLVIVLLVGVNVNRTTKLCNGGHLPMCIAAGFACAALIGGMRQMKQPGLRVAAYGAGCLAVVMMTATGFGMLLYGFRAHTYDSRLKDVALQIERYSLDDSFPAVLCDVRSARMLTVLGPVRVYAGHHALTPDYHAKREALIRAGIQPEPNGQWRDSVDEDMLKPLLKESNVDFLLIREDAPARRFADKSVHLRLISQTETWQLYDVTPKEP